MLRTTTLPSGSNLGMDTASWGAVGTLRRVLANELKVVNVTLSDPVIDALLSQDKVRIMKALKGTDVNAFKNLFLQLMGSKDLEDSLFACMIKCTLNGETIKPATFEPEGARGDFYPVALEVMKLNVLPFFETLLSTLKTSSATTPSSPK